MHWASCRVHLLKKAHVGICPKYNRGRLFFGPPPHNRAPPPSRATLRLHRRRTTSSTAPVPVEPSLFYRCLTSSISYYLFYQE